MSNSSFLNNILNYTTNNYIVICAPNITANLKAYLSEMVEKLDIDKILPALESRFNMSRQDVEDMFNKLETRHARIERLLDLLMEKEKSDTIVNASVELVIILENTGQHDIAKQLCCDAGESLFILKPTRV